MAPVVEAIAIARDWQHEQPPWAGNRVRLPANLPAITQQCIDMYLFSQGPQGGIGGIGWWQWANGYTAIALHDSWSGNTHNYQRLTDSLRKCEDQHANFINEFNDDTLWWALCCLHMYNIGNDPWFLDKARRIWQYVHAKNSVCGRGALQCCANDMEGGCFWTTKPGEGYVNSITTGLYAELSIRLALVSSTVSLPEKHGHFGSKLQSLLGSHRKEGPAEYLEAARSSLDWILRCVYRPRDAVVMDGMRTRKNELVDWTFTYTTGVTIGVCALIYEASREEDYMVLACHMAHRAMRNRGWVEEHGVLSDLGAWGKAPGEPGANGDGVGFKSVLIRHLGTLYDVIRKTNAQGPPARETAELIKTFMCINFASQQQNNTNGNGQYGPWWTGPFDMPTSHSQLAVLDVMAAARLVNRM
ncbi:hypothetical protein LTR91_017552 [Friedmanniomyces endolithicus]|uniref:Uncharacterized protein n=1 Tax=Friedmanniomyces endolithicus TaxID=329885 RepID=A0AAN6K5U1_9PEZI|nr:hypothetical protein LTR94_021785 [Friedmanniomyces endolithicus]KAK0769115.1 hypothetical protein LTR59_017215 [Friedmanniomyces endolithicus]KAK0773589.1 hypothetical protein LTR38_016519 [Friedmanniomyces endolithicus]KAK0827902.1 hypothetical protein LTR03_016767 [Friedmanniomyces endolithicus]KAK0855692.1 hypothetical protein LTS02_010964 [Friedmanniomyces endolithicus]